MLRQIPAAQGYYNNNGFSQKKGADLPLNKDEQYQML